MTILAPGPEEVRQRTFPFPARHFLSVGDLDRRATFFRALAGYVDLQRQARRMRILDRVHDDLAQDLHQHRGLFLADHAAGADLAANMHFAVMRQSRHDLVRAADQEFGEIDLPVRRKLCEPPVQMRDRRLRLAPVGRQRVRVIAQPRDLDLVVACWQTRPSLQEPNATFLFFFLRRILFRALVSHCFSLDLRKAR